MEHDGCKGCKYERESSHSTHCQGCTQNSTDKYTRMTNGDWIRNMTDEELSMILFKGCLALMKKEVCESSHGVSCENCILEWLLEERKDD